jgi:hypothetical protein
MALCEGGSYKVDTAMIFKLTAIKGLLNSGAINGALQRFMTWRQPRNVVLSSGIVNNMVLIPFSPARLADGLG